MPCYDSRNDRTYIINEVRQECEAEMKRLSNRCHELTQLLCEAGRARADRRIPSRKVRAWWREHSNLDAENGKPWNNPAR